MAIYFDNQTPIYVQIMDEIKREIILGKYTAGQKLPSVREFAMQFNVNPNTIQKALFELEWVCYHSEKCDCACEKAHKMRMKAKRAIAF